MFLLYQGKEGEGPGAPHSRPWPSRIQEQALAEGAIGPPVPPMGLIFPCLRKKPLIFSDPRLSYNARL